MSTAVFPALAGLKWSVKKTPMWNTQIQRAASGRSLSATNMSAPLWKFDLGYEFLRSASAFNEVQQLIGFFNSRYGRFDTFYYLDPSENSVTDQLCATTTNGVLAYNLCKSWGGQFIEPIGAINGSPTNVKLDGTPTAAYTVSGNVITLNTNPGAGKLLTWTGNFYYKVRFAKDMEEVEQFMKDLWQAQKIEMESVK